MPMAAISILDNDRQWFPVELGLDASETARAASFCAHAMTDAGHVMCIPDAASDGRFAGNPLVLAGPHIRFYAGMPLVADNGQPLGALCVLDRVRGAPASAAQIAALGDLARRAMRRAASLR
jgi:GAF domain-containing protein